MKNIIIAISLFFLLAPSVNADLVDNGDGTITDTDFNLMWLKDAKYAMTSGYDTDGKMGWDAAMTWADTLYYAGYDDWRLPSALNSDGSGPCSGDNCTDSEMGHLYYIEGITSGGYDPFLNLSGNRWWSSTETEQSPNIWQPWRFHFGSGSGEQSQYSASAAHFVWAVRDISVVPEPISAILFITGGATLGFRRLRKRVRG